MNGKRHKLQERQHEWIPWKKKEGEWLGKQSTEEWRWKKSQYERWTRRTERPSKPLTVSPLCCTFGNCLPRSLSLYLFPHTLTNTHTHSSSSQPGQTEKGLLLQFHHSKKKNLKKKSGSDYLFYKLGLQQSGEWKHIVLPLAASYHILCACRKYDLWKYKVIKKDGPGDWTQGNSSFSSQTQRPYMCILNEPKLNTEKSPYHTWLHLSCFNWSLELMLSIDLYIAFSNCVVTFGPVDMFYC